MHGVNDVANPAAYASGAIPTTILPPPAAFARASAEDKSGCISAIIDAAYTRTEARLDPLEPETFTLLVPLLILHDEARVAIATPLNPKSGITTNFNRAYYPTRPTWTHMWALSKTSVQAYYTRKCFQEAAFVFALASGN